VKTSYEEATKNDAIIS